MLYTIVIMLKCTTRVVRRIYKNTLHLPRILLLERLERQQVIPKNQLVVENVALADTVLRVIAPFRFVEQDARL